MKPRVQSSCKSTKYKHSGFYTKFTLKMLDIVKTIKNIYKHDLFNICLLCFKVKYEYFFCYLIEIEQQLKYISHTVYNKTKVLVVLMRLKTLTNLLFMH